MTRARLIFPAVTACMLMLSGCVGAEGRQPPSRIPAAQVSVEAASLRVRRLARPLLVANADRCSRQLWDFGFTARTQPAGPAGPEAARVIPSGGYLVTRVYPAGPAAEAGVRPDDQVIAVNGARWPDPQFLATFAKADKADPDAQRLTLEFARGDERYLAVLTGERTCAIPGALIVRRQINAVANATGYGIFSRLEEVMVEDDQLSAVIAHELAHVILGHNAATLPRGRERFRRRQAEEQAADALSVRLLLRAGIDPEAAVRAVGTLGRHRGPFTRLLGMTGPYLPTARRQQFLRDQITVARAEDGALK